MTLDTPDALLLDQTLNRVAADLHALGDTHTRDQRRATAVGILADPQHALDLMSGRDTDNAAGASNALGADTRSRRKNRGTGGVTLYLHLTPADLTTGHVAVTGTGTSAGAVAEAGVVQIEHLGAATTSLIEHWLTRHDLGPVTIRPVIDLRDEHTGRPAPEPAVDRHDPPAAMREHVLLRDAHCVFPGCRRDSRRRDLDHITEYLPLADGGPPGQTRASALAPLCRTHHRVKTHSSWTYKRRDDGTYTWTSPTGHQYDVTVPGRQPPDRGSSRSGIWSMSGRRADRDRGDRDAALRERPR